MTEETECYLAEENLRVGCRTTSNLSAVTVGAARAVLMGAFDGQDWQASETCHSVVISRQGRLIVAL